MPARLFGLLAAGLGATAAAGQPPISEGGRVFATQILGAERAASVDRLEALPMWMTPSATRIRFYYPPTRLSGDLCRRSGHETMVSFDVVREGRERLTDLVELALGPDCRSADRPFAVVERDVSLMQAADSLRAARDAQAAAATGEALPFDLLCEDELRQGCADGGRPTLAALPIDQARIISGEGVFIARTHEFYWIVRVFDRNGRKQVVLRRRRPLSL